MAEADQGYKRWAPLVATLAAAALGVALGTWQLGRAEEKRELRDRYERLSRDAPVAIGAAEIAAEDVELRRVTARGVFEPRYAVFLDNRVLNGVPGYHVVMPLQLPGGRAVLVNRGWVAGVPDRSQLPQVRTPAGSVEVSGIAMVPGRQLYELSKQVTEGAVWQNLTMERYRAAHPLAVQPFMIRQDSALDDGLKREWNPPDFGIDKHFAYAAQWFMLAATVLIFYLFVHVRRRNSNTKK